MNFVFILLVVLVLLSGATYYGYHAGYYDVRRLGSGLFVIVVVLAIFFMLARPN